MRNLDAGEEPVEDSEIDVQLRHQARKLVIASLVSALVITAVVVIVMWRPR